MQVTELCGNHIQVIFNSVVNIHTQVFYSDTTRTTRNFFVLTTTHVIVVRTKFVLG